LFPFRRILIWTIRLIYLPKDIAWLVPSQSPLRSTLGQFEEKNFPARAAEIAPGVFRAICNDRSRGVSQIARGGTGSGGRGGNSGGLGNMGQPGPAITIATSIDFIIFIIEG